MAGKAKVTPVPAPSPAPAPPEPAEANVFRDEPAAAKVIDLNALPKIQLKRLTTVEGIEGLGNRTRTLTVGDPATRGLELDYLPTINAVRAKLPGKQRLIAWANCIGAEPL